MKKWVSLVLLFALLVTLTACGTKTSGTGAKDYRIGIVTGTVSQNEDEYRGAERIIKKYGADKIKHVTYPDSFMTEQETTIAQITGLAEDPLVKAIVINQAVPGTLAAISKVKQTRPEMIFILGEPHEDPDEVGQAATFAMTYNEIKRGKTIPEMAKKLGAKTFIHYSFPRHMSYPLLAERRRIMEETCKELGINFVFVTAPDPTSDIGLAGAQKFILEDVPKQVATYGKDTAFFSTNCGMQEPLIKSVVETGAIYPEPCCPSPTHGFPGALGIEITPDIAGNFPEIINVVKNKIAEKGMSGRLATWPVSVNMLYTEAGVELARAAIEGRVDLSKPEECSKIVEKECGVKIDFQPYKDGSRLNMLILESIIF